MAKALNRTGSSNVNTIINKHKSTEVNLGDAYKKDKKEKFRQNILSQPDASLIPEQAESHIQSHIFKESENSCQQEPKSHQAVLGKKLDLIPKAHDKKKVY